MIEILAPAGDEKSFYSAISSGANAVYLGLSNFSARKNATNFNIDNLKFYIDYAHFFGARVYVAMNTLIKNSELNEFLKNVVNAHNLGVDAIILHDIFLGKVIKEKCPQITLHLSTQAGVCNVYGAKLAKKYGFSRVILARETPIDSIKQITKIIETEIFIQGALCTCFSGQCYMSSFVGANSGNRGFCKQPCRKKYKISRKGFDNYSNAKSRSELSVGKDILKLKEAGVVSFKIEGRMRSPEYVSAAVNYYKKILAGDDDLNVEYSNLKRTYNRNNYTKGYVYGQDKNLLSVNLQNHIGEYIGKIKRIDKYAFIESEYPAREGDGFKVIRGGKTEIGGFIYNCAKKCERNGFYVIASSRFAVGDEVYLTSDSSLAQKVKNDILKRKITLEISINEYENVIVKASGDFQDFEMKSNFCADIAINAGISEKDIKDCFSKVDAYPFIVEFSSIKTSGKAFVLRSILNNFRRDFFKLLFEHIACKNIDMCNHFSLDKDYANNQTFDKRVIIDCSFDKKVYGTDKIDYFVFKPKNYKNHVEIDEFLENSKYYVTHKLLYISAFSLDLDIENIKNIVANFDGIYCDGYFGIELAKELNKPFVLGTGANVFNFVDCQVLNREKPLFVVLSKELSYREIDEMRNFNATFLVGGNIKIMDLGHCLFSKTCKNCDKKNRYILTDESGREFVLNRYENSVCRFELYNCAVLLSNVSYGGVLDFTSLTLKQKRSFLAASKDNVNIKDEIGNYTFGHFKKGIN